MSASTPPPTPPPLPPLPPLSPPAQPPGGYYPQQAYYAPGWQAPLPAEPQVHNRRRTRIALLAVGGVLAVALAVGIALGARYLLDTRPLGAVTAARDAGVRQLDVGHCVEQLPDDGEVTRVRVVPCADPHAAEVVGKLTLPAGPWPGQVEVDRRVAAWCEMDTTQHAAGFAPVVWTPAEAAWGQGDRHGLCLAWLDGGGATGSFTAGDAVTAP